MVGVLYGLPLVHPHRLLVATIAASGCILQTIYVTIFFIFSDRIKRLKVIMWLLFELIFITILIIVTLIGVHNLKTRSEIVGTISVALTIMMYASPLAIMKMVVKTKSVEYMPLFISLASFGNSVAWTTYALISFDPFLTPYRLDHLTVQVLDKLPRVLFDEDLRARDSVCCVCLGEFELKEEVLQIPYCKHVFHIECIHNWLQSNTTCPLCRCFIIPTTITTKFLTPPPSILLDPPQQSGVVSTSPSHIISLPPQLQDEASVSSNYNTHISRE
ncbi:hypothetical protein TanjilG_04855 [Lupinus angustifolius]|uniref:Bidirectional sugar transporter SWEET n=1 Tax=Lupinus angustifolius TaxID=3871 RepID=A0A4P1QSE2_LUPAN|nr:hypothetical protein TanjilG_04855 [Lupinus angustifolius]